VYSRVSFACARQSGRHQPSTTTRGHGSRDPIAPVPDTPTVLERVWCTRHVRARRGTERESDGGGEPHLLSCAGCCAAGRLPITGGGGKRLGPGCCGGGIVSRELTRMTRSSPSGAHLLRDHEDGALGKKPLLRVPPTCSRRTRRSLHRPPQALPASGRARVRRSREFALREGDDVPVARPRRGRPRRRRPLPEHRPVPGSGRPGWWCWHRTGSRSSGSVGPA